jgi:hypothetical protein
MKDYDKPARNIFFNKIENRFESFKNKIVKLSYKNNIGFDEDVFMDSILRCTETFKNENATEIDVDNYFWKAYKQNMISSRTRDKFKNFVPLDKIKDDNNDCVYSDDIDEIVKIITKEVRENFGDKILDAWLLHICNGVTYEELECEYAGLNLHNEFRQIKRHITQKYVNKNPKLKRLLSENNLIS